MWGTPLGMCERLQVVSEGASNGRCVQIACAGVAAQEADEAGLQNAVEEAWQEGLAEGAGEP